MGELLNLTAADGHQFEAYLATPPDKILGGLVMIQEIFGMTGQMQRCADRFAQAGYLTILPAMFDRVERGLRVAYTDFQTGGKAASAIPEAQVLADVEAARSHVASVGKTAIIGYCWGGTVAFMGASALPFDCAVSYYGGGIGRLLDRLGPRVPVQYHFGADDSFIPMDVIERIRSLDEKGEVFVYEGAGHGFNCDDREGFHAGASSLSEERALAFLGRHLAGPG